MIQVNLGPGYEGWTRLGPPWLTRGRFISLSTAVCGQTHTDRRAWEHGKWAIAPVTLHPMIIKVQQDRQVLEVQEVLESCCLVQHIL